MSRIETRSIHKLFAVLGLCCCLVLLGSALLAGEKDEQSSSEKAQKAAPAKAKSTTPAQQKEKTISPYEAAARKPTAQDADVKVYTNADLENINPLSDIPPTVLPAGAEEPEPEQSQPPASDPNWDPLAQLEQRRDDAAQHNELIATAKAEVAAAEKKIAELEQRKRAVTNPYLPRPGEVEDEEVDWKSMGPQERLKWTENALAAAREELQAAQERLRNLGAPR